ncbi:hypothetical protein [Fangia hongkongensis]|uniref:hypothetical protein n=1 Tax=Fangia hongkongensis TaxID=270495 RepID=UPI000367BEFA|nr:hypothetical protein [Fangia hongkongensis]MBK2124815.1 hypothetical protein [Fangia hongkongensis]
MKFTLTQANPESEIFSHSGGEIQVQSAGTYGGATINMSVAQDDLTFVVLDDFSMTKDDVLNVNIKANSKYKFSLTSATGSTNIEVSII